MVGLIVSRVELNIAELIQSHNAVFVDGGLRFILHQHLWDLVRLDLASVCLLLRLLAACHHHAFLLSHGALLRPVLAVGDLASSLGPLDCWRLAGLRRYNTGVISRTRTALLAILLSIIFIDKGFAIMRLGLNDWRFLLRRITAMVLQVLLQLVYARFLLMQSSIIPRL